MELLDEESSRAKTFPEKMADSRAQISDFTPDAGAAAAAMVDRSMSIKASTRVRYDHFILVKNHAMKDVLSCKEQ